MKTLKLSLLFAVALLLSCKKKSSDDTTLAKPVVYNAKVVVCGVNNPFVNIPWLSEFYKMLSGAPETNAIVLYSYEGKEVIELQSWLFSSMYYHEYYCDGSRIALANNTELNDFLSKRKEVAVLFGRKIR